MNHTPMCVCEAVVLCAVCVVSVGASLATSQRRVNPVVPVALRGIVC